jgi:hypothetical protein
MGGMGGFSGLVDKWGMNNSVSNLGTEAGEFDSGCATGLQVAGAALGVAGNAAMLVIPGGEEAKGAEIGGNFVYRALDESGNVLYVGMTNDLKRRAAEQAADKGIDIEAIDGLENLSRYDARAAEQALIEYHGLPNLLNKINSIATSNPIYEGAIARGQQLLNQVGYPGL